jgi:hypothetical protein
LVHIPRLHLLHQVALARDMHLVLFNGMGAILGLDIE